MGFQRLLTGAIAIMDHVQQMPLSQLGITKELRINEAELMVEDSGCLRSCEAEIRRPRNSLACSHDITCDVQSYNRSRPPQQEVRLSQYEGKNVYLQSCGTAVKLDAL